MKRLLHELVIQVSRIFSRFLPDRIPVTFVGSDASRELCESIFEEAHGGIRPAVRDILLLQGFAVNAARAGRPYRPTSSGLSSPGLRA
jgi:hypothetical protein